MQPWFSIPRAEELRKRKTRMVPRVGCSRSLWAMTTPWQPEFGGGSMGRATGATDTLGLLDGSGAWVGGPVVDKIAEFVAEPRGAAAE
jgi:hypothetical protein